MCRALYEEKSLISPGGKDIKHGKEILELSDAKWAPEKEAVMHCQGRSGKS